MAIERTYTIPLRSEWQKTPKYRRSKRAIAAVRAFLVRHMKSEDVRLGTNLNLEIWKHGIKNPPSKVTVNVLKDDKGVVRAELPGFPLVVEKLEEEKKGIIKKLTEKIGKPEKKEGVKKVEEKKVTPEETKPEEKKPEAPKEVKKETPKVEEKKEEVKKEAPEEKKPEPKVEKTPAKKPAEKAE